MKLDIDMRRLYFAYGANTNLQCMASLCPDSRLIGPAVLMGYRVCFKYHADIVPDPTSVTHGLLWHLSDTDLDNLDIVEGYPDYYARDIFEIRVGEGRSHIAWSYYMKNTDKLEKPDHKYLQKCRDGYIENNLPLTQLEQALEECNGF